MRFQGEVWRHIPAGNFPLHVGYILKAEGRWNVPGEYGCIYTALTRQGAEAEYIKHLSRYGSSPAMSSPRDLITLIVNASPILDQTSKKTSLVDPGSPFLTGSKLEDIEKCRELADLARDRGFQGILAPSASLPGEKNLIIYVDGIASNVDLKEGKIRIPLNYKP